MNPGKAAAELPFARPRSVPDVIAEQLRDAILSGRLRAGERLVEQKLAAAFGIGQPTIREAFRELELQGFVRKQGSKGTYVTEFSDEDIRKNLEVRMALESLAVEKAAPNIKPEDARVLKRCVAEMATSIASFDRAGFHKADVAFHRKIWDLAENEYLKAALERVTFGLFAFLLVARTPNDTVMRHVVAQHQAILDALLTRNSRKAREGFERATVRFWKEHQGVDAGQGRHAEGDRR